MDKTINKKPKYKIVLSVSIYVVAGLLFVLAFIGIFTKLSGNSIPVFGYRLDVVLTDSMSYKNPEYEEFLKGHDNQIQAKDVAITKVGVPEKELDVYDIVLFNNPMLHVTDMHRIVGRTLKDQDEITALKSHFNEINGIKGITFDSVKGGIVSNVICAKQITLATYSTVYDERDHFVFSYQAGLYDATVSREAKDGGYYTYYNVSIDYEYGRTLTIGHKCEYDYSSEVISTCLITTDSGVCDLNENTLSVKDDGLFGAYNQRYYYEIRGDAANTSDGKSFTINDIVGKVVGSIPKIGYFIRYLSSVWGMVSLIGIGVLIIAFDIISSRMAKKEQQSTMAESNQTSKEEEVEDEQEKSNDN